MSDRKIPSVIRGSSVSSTSRIQRVVIENMKVRERTTDLRAMTVELMALNASGMREKSQKRAQRMRRGLKYQAGSYASMRRCHFSWCVQVPCSLRLYSSVSVGTSVCFKLVKVSNSVKRVKGSKVYIHIRSIAFCLPAVRLWIAVPEILLGSPCLKTFQLLYGSSACQ